MYMLYAYINIKYRHDNFTHQILHHCGANSENIECMVMDSEIIITIINFITDDIITRI